MALAAPSEDSLEHCGCVSLNLNNLEGCMVNLVVSREHKTWWLQSNAWAGDERAGFWGLVGDSIFLVIKLGLSIAKKIYN